MLTRWVVAICALLILLATIAWLDRPTRSPPISVPVDVTPKERALLRSQRFYIAMNAHNSESILRSGVPQLLRLVKTLGPSRCLVSIYENGGNGVRGCVMGVCTADGKEGVLLASGSSDRSPYYLAVLARHLRQLGVTTEVVTESWRPWWRLCPEMELDCDVEECQELCPNLESTPRMRGPRAKLMRQDMLDDDMDLFQVCGELEHCSAPLRVPLMAGIRNRALEHLEAFVKLNPGDTVRVLFLNDVFISVRSVVQ